jgi:hypothetical protein
VCYKTTRRPKRGESVLNIYYFSLFENLNISRDGVDLKWKPTLALNPLIRLKVRNMEGASSANKSCSRQMFDSVFEPDELESGSELGPSMSDQQHVSTECTDPIRKRRELGPRGSGCRFSGEWNISNNNFEASACTCFHPLIWRFTSIWRTLVSGGGRSLFWELKSFKIAKSLARNRTSDLLPQSQIMLTTNL